MTAAGDNSLFFKLRDYAINSAQVHTRSRSGFAGRNTSANTSPSVTRRTMETGKWAGV
jgi:hypothetical protein